MLPGVTVEAASRALIERTRTVVTDADGQCKIINLRPGTYTVTFSLSGFKRVKREGIELTTGFTATVNGGAGFNVSAGDAIFLCTRLSAHARVGAAGEVEPITTLSGL